MVIRRVDVSSAAKVAAVLYGAIGLAAGLIIACISLVGAGFMTQAAKESEVPAAFGAFLGVGAIIVAPIFYGVLGAIVGAVSAAVYNLAAGMIGGLQIDVE